MRIFGLEIDLSTGASEEAYRAAICAVMKNPRIGIGHGVELFNMLIRGELTEQQLMSYQLSQNGPVPFSNKEIFANLDLWQEHLGTFSDKDMQYLHSDPTTINYNAKPSDIKGMVQYICQRVMGQNEAVERIVTAAWMHVNSVRKGLGVKVPAQMLVGATGVGKTQILNHLANLLNVHIINIFASVITAPGYRGGDSLVDQVFSNIATADLSDNQPVLIIIHEIDKTVRGVNDGYRVELLGSIMSLIEKNSLHKANPMGSSMSLDLKNVLVLFDGAFEGIEKVVAKRMGLGRVGFNQQDYHSCLPDLRGNVTKADLVEYGMMPEFVGRLSDPICLNSMSRELMFSILSESVDSPVKAYINAFKQYGKTLDFTTEALQAMAQMACENIKFGARSLDGVVNTIMQPYIWLLTSKTTESVSITLDDINQITNNRNCK